jgi:hypothetical protein
MFHIPDSIRPKLRWRVGNMLLHPSFSRRFRNPFSSIASWQIEDCSRALQCFLPMIFRPERSGPQQPPLLQPDLAKRAFGHLKRFAAFHLGHVKYSSTLEYITAAQEAHAEPTCAGGASKAVVASPSQRCKVYRTAVSACTSQSVCILQVLSAVLVLLAVALVH